jgi:hypothetical protein
MSDEPIQLGETVHVLGGEGQQLSYSVGAKGTVVKDLGAFVLVDLGRGELRGCLRCYLEVDTMRQMRLRLRNWDRHGKKER